MSVNLYVSCRKSALPTLQKWHDAIKSAGFDLVLDDFDWQTQSGYLPVTYMGTTTGFELWVEDAQPLAEDLNVNLPAQNDVIVSFVVGSDKIEAEAAACASAALAHCIDGLYFDEFCDDLLDGKTAINVARDSIQAD